MAHTYRNHPLNKNSRVLAQITSKIRRIFTSKHRTALYAPLLSVTAGESNSQTHWVSLYIIVIPLLSSAEFAAGASHLTCIGSCSPLNTFLSFDCSWNLRSAAPRMTLTSNFTRQYFSPVLYQCRFFNFISTPLSLRTDSTAHNSRAPS